MEGYDQYCDSIGMYSDRSLPGGLYSPAIEHLLMDNSSSLSDAGTPGSSTIRSSGCDEDGIMLASSHPKKRTGRKKFKETRHPVYRGVRMRNSNRWVCEVREPNKRNRIWLGTYPTPEMAARAHDVAALALRGIKGCLNFADSSWRLPKPASSDPEDIQRAAAEAAAMFSIDIEEDDDDAVHQEDEESVAISTIDNDKDTCNIGGSKSDEIFGKYQKPAYYHMEDEEIFDMPGLLNDMAEGLLLSPPSSYLNGQYTWDMDNPEKYSDMNLWNHHM